MPKPIGAADPQEMPAILDIKESQLPQIKEWRIGGKYKVLLTVEQVSQSKGYDGTGPHRASFKVISAKSAGEVKGGDVPDEPAPREAKLAALKGKARSV